MIKTEEQVREIYRAYIELWASFNCTNNSVLYGAILAYGRVLGYKATKIEKDLEMAKNKYK